MGLRFYVLFIFSILTVLGAMMAGSTGQFLALEFLLVVVFYEFGRAHLGKKTVSVMKYIAFFLAVVFILLALQKIETVLEGI